MNMTKQNEQFEWKEQRELFEQAVSIEKGYGNYDVLLLPNERYVILDRSNSKFLLPSSGSLYTLPDNWKDWLERGFIVISFLTTFGDTKYYIFSTQSKKFIAEAIRIDARNFFLGKSDYFIVKNDDLKKAIFDKDGKQVSDWLDEVETSGLYKGRSGYYIAEKDGKEAIFYKNGKQISEWFTYIKSYGLVQGQSDYYIVTRNNKEAIFHKDGQQISDWYDGIDPEGLVEGQSDYYLVINIDKQDIFHDKKAIFHKNGKQVTDWFYGDMIDGVLNGYSEYYVVKAPSFEDNLYYICRLGSTKVVGPLKNILDYGFIKDPSKNTVALTMLDGQSKTLTKQELDNFFEEKEMENEK
jgi:hypothetical protein